MEIVLYIGILVYMYLGNSIAAKIGVTMVMTHSTIILVLLFVRNLFFFELENILQRFKVEFLVVLIGMITMLLKYITGDVAGIKLAFFFMIFPVLLSILLETQSVFTKYNIRNIVLFFFVTECGLAIIEKVLGMNFFTIVTEGVLINSNQWSFRSTAFLSHPLANALVVSMIMGFVLTSSMRLRNKILFVLLGFVSLLCFNARGAILMWGIIGMVAFIYVLKYSNRVRLSPIMIITFAIIALGGVTYLMLHHGFGGRLVHDDIMDASANTRMEVFRALSYITADDFWYGNSKNYVSITQKLEAGGVENSYIVIILNYGIIMFFFWFMGCFFFIKTLLNTYSKVSKWLVFSSFILVGSMNNALAGTVPWVFFVICVHSFPFVGKEELKKQLLLYYLIKNKSKKNENYSRFNDLP